MDACILIPAAETTPVEQLPGVTRTTLSYGADSMLCLFELQKGALIPLHNHPASQNGYILSGKVLLLGSQEEAVKAAGAGDSYYIPPHQTHGMQVLETARIVENFSPMRPEFIVK